MNDSTDIKQVTENDLDNWATMNDGPVALRLKQRLLPVEESGIIFPPTYADIGYNIDTLSDGTRVATIDSVGSQANRLEPIFKSESKDPNDWLVPQIEILIHKEACGECENCKSNAGNAKKANKECKQPREVTRSLLDLAHRAADAVVQSSPDLLKLIEPAFKRLQQGDAGPLCTVAPTSLVFGVWDSRGNTGEKRPRLVRSIIRAWDVEPLHAAAQFNSIWKLLDEEQQEELKKEAKAKKTDLSEKGLADAPATFRKTKVQQYRDGLPNPEARVLGGVLVKGSIEREVTVNLVALRGLRGENDQETTEIRKYLLGLSLMAATADIELYLREGCLLRYAENGDAWYEVPRRGEPTPIRLDVETIKEYARETAGPFRTKWPAVFNEKWPKGDGEKSQEGEKSPALKYEFNLDAAKKLLQKKVAEEEKGNQSE
ncbi:type I-G CRISPR-associated RAMP protein Csb1/Cas7g [Rehaibacterium terrae]|jgi:CRISPR-associated protein Csb1|uniref:CRISPR-associated protein Csb1 n=1 Tax=Rehaibacterium terrae TaxID=1341696 RepID=A0A7W7Y259_9GAMM|nr:type I-U CRISPR-associated RAMP protein Csb1/Cas7u [Rehaibacterium terrae]MBB5016453.1 CRISPR-associated protein Csb1 [Rehaibacterium terrae]